MPRPAALPWTPLVLLALIAPLPAQDDDPVEAPPPSSRPELPALADVARTLHVHVGEDRVETTARLDYTVLRGTLREVCFAMPEGREILDLTVSGATLDEWTTDGGLVTLRLTEAASSRFSVHVAAECAAADFASEVTGSEFQPQDVFRDSGRLVVTHDPALAVVAEPLPGMSRVAAGEIPEADRRPGAAYLRFHDSECQLRLHAVPAETRAAVRQDIGLRIDGESTAVESVLIWTSLPREGRQLAVQLPDGFRVEHVSEADYQIDAARRLTVRTTRPAPEVYALQITGHCPLGEAVDGAHELPLPRPLAARSVGGVLSIRAPSTIDVRLPEALTHGFRAEDSMANGTESAAAWSFGELPESVRAIVAPKSPRVSAETDTRIVAGTERVRVASEITWHVADGALDTLLVAVPAEAVKTLRTMSSEGEHVPTTRALADGQTLCSIALPRPATGDQSLRVTWTQDSAEVAKGSSALGGRSAAVQPPRVMTLRADDSAEPLSDCSGRVGMLASPDAWAIATAGETASPLDAEPGTQVWRFEGTTPMVSLEISPQTREPVGTIVDRALVETVISRDRWAVCRCRYRIASLNGSRLPVGLPALAEVLDVRLGGRAVSLEPQDGAPADADWKACAADVTPAEADAPPLLTLVYRIPVDERSFRSRRGILLLPLPRVGGLNPEASVVRELRTVIWFPDGYMVVGLPTGFSLQRRHGVGAALLSSFRHPHVDDADEWIGGADPSSVPFRTAGHPVEARRLGDAEYLELSYWDERFATWLLSGAVILGALVLRPTSWGNRLSMTVGTTLVVAAMALVSANAVWAGIAAARWGIAVAAAVWIADTLVRRRRSRTPHPAPVALAPVALAPVALAPVALAPCEPCHAR